MKSSIVLFDGVCNLCSKSVQVILKYDKNRLFKFASLQSDFGQQVLKENNMESNHFSSFILLENDILYTKSTAALRIAKEFSFPMSLLYIFIIVPMPVRDFIYQIIADNRYKWFGKQEQCAIPSPEYKDRFID